MKKFALSASVVIAFFAYSFFTKQQTSSDITGTVPSSTPAASPDVTSGTTASDTPAPAASAQQNSGKFKNGVYTGNVADAFYGNVQVRATVTNNQISDVTFLQYPNDRSTSRFINSQAMPLLSSEAISAQDANVDIVSGATDTSHAFITSLTSALNQAK